MGTYIYAEPMSTPEIRCIYRTSCELTIHFADRVAWSVILDKLPDSYTMRERNDKPPVIDVEFSYVAASANQNDLTKRLKAITGFEYWGYEPLGRVSICGCPPGTRQCIKRLTEESA